MEINPKPFFWMVGGTRGAGKRKGQKKVRIKRNMEDPTVELKGSE